MELFFLIIRAHPNKILKRRTPKTVKDHHGDVPLHGLFHYHSETGRSYEILTSRY